MNTIRVITCESERLAQQAAETLRRGYYKSAHVKKTSKNSYAVMINDSIPAPKRFQKVQAQDLLREALRLGSINFAPENKNHPTDLSGS